MNAGMYIRKSRTEELSDSVEETLRRHREILSEFAKEQGIYVTHIYEEVVSGESLYARPQMLQLLEDMERGEFDAVLCMDIDRLGRGGMSDQGIILETFKHTDTKIITPRKIYDLNNELDEEYTEFETFMARRELKIIKRRMQRGIQKSVQEGCYLANAPYGYRNVVVDRRPTLAIEESEARYVRMMYDLYVNQGKGCQAIADLLNAMGAKPHRSNRFCRTSVMHILKNPTFTGKVVWNQKTHIRNNTRENKKSVTIYHPREEWTIVPGRHPAIIEEQLFEQAQEIFQKRYHPPSFNGTVENPLAGLVFCANCGSLMQRQRMPSGEAYLLCPHKTCTVSSKLPLVEQAVVQYLQCVWGEIPLKWERETSKAEQRYQPLLIKMEEEALLLQKQQERLYELLEQGVYEVDVFQERRQRLQEKIKKIQESKEWIQNRIHGPKEKQSCCPCQTIRQVLLGYGRASPQQRNQLLKCLIERIDYKKEKGSPPDGFTLWIQRKSFYR